MKKHFILIILIVCSNLSSNAQFIGLRGGFSLSSITTNLNSSISKATIKPINGLQYGIIAEFPLSTTLKWLTMETGLIIQHRGSDLTWTTYTRHQPLGQSTYYSYSWSTESSNFTGKTYLQYLDILLSVKMYTSVGKTSLYFQIGPYVGIGLSGKHHDYYNYINKISWGSTISDDYRKFDSGLSMGLGLKIKPFLIGLSYDLGLVNICPALDIFHNRVFSVFTEFMIIHKDKSIKK